MSDCPPRETPCPGCPWIKDEPRDRELLVKFAARAALQGEEFRCHTNGGVTLCAGVVIWRKKQTHA